MPTKQVLLAQNTEITLFFLPSTSNTDKFPFRYISSPGGWRHTHLACRQKCKQKSQSEAHIQNYNTFCS